VALSERLYYLGSTREPATVPTPPSSTLSAPESAIPSGVDPDLLSLPAPPKRERTATVILMALTALAAAWMSVSLLAEARYALTAGQPIDVGDLTSLHPQAPGSDGAGLANRYVRASGLLGTSGAIRYGRAAEGDSFRLAPVAGNPGLWVEIRVPEGFEGPRFVPPTTFAGRLVPFRRSGVRHVRLMSAVHGQTEVTVPDDAWLLIDGSSPRASRWAVALAALFVGFAAWNIAGVARILSRVRDERLANVDEGGAEA
jgi:hypothetical protein